MKFRPSIRLSPHPMRWIPALAVSLLLHPPAAPSTPEFLWARAFDNLGFSRAEAIAVDAAGNTYLTGSFAGTVDFDPGPGIFTLTAQGGSDIFVAKLDAAGAFVWARAFYGEGTNEGLAIAVDAAGNVYTTGRFAGTADFDPNVTVFTLTPPGGQGIFVSKLDANGHFVWANAVGGGNSVNDTGFGIAIDAEGNVLTTGAFSGITDFDTGPVGHLVAAQGSEDIFIRKLDSNGNFLWVRAFQGISPARPRAIAVDSGGNIYTTGRFQGTIDFDPGPVGFPLTAAGDDTIGEGDAFVSKLNANGEFVWAGAFGGIGSNAEGLDIAVDSGGNVLITGHYRGIVDFDPGQPVFELSSGFLENAFVAKLAPDGTFAWARGLGNDGAQRGYGIAADALGDVYATGDFEGPADFDPGPNTFVLTTPAGVHSAFVWKLDAAGGLAWARAADGPGVSRAFALALDGGGNILTAGAFTDTVDFSPGLTPTRLTAPSGGPMVFVMRLGQGDAVVKMLSGSIQNAITGGPVACAVVELTGPAGGQVAAVTDFAGAYFFEPLPPGEYAVRLHAPGFETPGQSPVTLAPAEVTTLDFTLEPAADRPVLAGEVTGAAGGGKLAAASVRLRVGGSIVAETLTCADGRYEIPLPSSLPSGDFQAQIAFDLDNYNAQTVQTTINAAAGATVNAALQPSRTGNAALTVRVFEQGASLTPPIANARITLRGPMNASFATGANGVFTSNTLLGGFYTLTASAAGFEGKSVRRQLGAGPSAQADFVLERRETPVPPGPADINGDGVVNAVDVQLVINAALGLDIAPFDADINGDGVVNAVDVQRVINAALGIGVG